MTKQLVTPVRHLVTAMAVACVAAGPAGAQTGAPQGAGPGAPQAAPSGPVLMVSMEQAVEMALESNLGLRASRLDTDVADQSITAARAAFLPFANLNLSRNNAESQTVTNADGTRTNSSSTALNGSTTVSQFLPWLGGGYQVTWGGNRNSTSGLSTFNPQLGSNLSIAFQQPLWRDLSIDQNRAGLETSQRNRVIADLRVQQSVVQLDTAVRNTYLSLIAAIERNKVANENMRVAEESLRQARARVEVGVSPEIEIVESEAQVEGGREAVIQSEADIQTAKDSLRRLILDPSRPDYWQVDLQPADTISLSEPSIDVERAIANALANRLDLQQQRRALEITDLNARLSDNATKPSVDLTVNFRSSAFGGTQVLGGGETATISYGNVLADTFTAAFPSWTVGVSVGLPIGPTAAKAGVAQLQVQQRQQLLTLREAELQVVEQVRAAAREVETSYRRVRALERSREATERQLEAEERRFAVGLSTTFQLQSRQSQLFTARFLEVQAIIGHQRALINFERVQKTQ